VASGGENGIASRSAFPQAALMNTVQEIEVAITHLSLAEMRQVHEWLETPWKTNWRLPENFRPALNALKKKWRPV
jgi:hypothetical protein